MPSLRPVNISGIAEGKPIADVRNLFEGSPSDAALGAEAGGALG